MFYDARLEEDALHPSGFQSPADLDLPEGLESALAAQAMFPVTSVTEMAGQDGENEVAHAAATGNLAGPDGVWELLAQRLRDNDEYAQMLVDAFEDVTSVADITFVHAANAIAAFEGAAWRATDSPFDRFLRGDRHAMSLSAQKGMRLFYGAAGCASCHRGVFQTDHQFHAVAMPQIGPGKGDGPDGRDDYGRERVTGNPADRYKFRTPSLRNVALTAPYGHDGAYDTLEAAVHHQFDPVEGLDCYDTGQAVLPSRPDLDAQDFVVHNDPSRRAEIAAFCELDPVQLTETQFGQLMDFLHALTDPGSVDLRWDVPTRVPSGASLVE
jgi:cytochrome c peroxidase